MKNVTIQKRDIRIKYGVDLQTVESLAKEYEVSTKQMKDVIRECGMKVRKNEEKEETSETQITLI